MSNSRAAFVPLWFRKLLLSLTFAGKIDSFKLRPGIVKPAQLPLNSIAGKLRGIVGRAVKQ
jgi:hypothetical protein